MITLFAILFFGFLFGAGSAYFLFKIVFAMVENKVEKMRRENELEQEYYKIYKEEIKKQGKEEE